MTTIEKVDELKPFEARAIIENLRKGSVPFDFVPLFSVGRKKWIDSIDDDLENYIAEGGAKVRFVNGDYGDGKTHFMSVVRHLALQKKFAVSFVVLTRDVPVHKFEVIYKEIVRQLSGSFNGSGLRGLLDHWTESLSGEFSSSGGSSNDEKLSTLGDTLRGIPGMDLNFANALISLVEKRFYPLSEGETQKERAEAIETVTQWFEGAKIAKKDLKPFQIFESLSKANSKLFLNSIIVFLRHLGYKGLVLLVDELETIIPQSASVRNAGYENVRLLIDNTEQAGNFYILFSIIPDVLLSEKGFKSYDALWSRVRSVGEGKKLNYRGILVDLHRTPLHQGELVELGQTLRRIHEAAYRWESEGMITDDLIQKVCAAQERMGLLSEVRLYIKQIIRYLDMGEQGEAPELEGSLEDEIVTAQRELEQEREEQLGPNWDS